MLTLMIIKKYLSPVPGKLDARPSLLVKFLSGGSGQEMGNSSSSEGEKDSPPPEWDIVPITKSSSSKSIFAICFFVVASTTFDIVLVKIRSDLSIFKFQPVVI